MADINPDAVPDPTEQPQNRGRQNPPANPPLLEAILATELGQNAVNTYAIRATGRALNPDVILEPDEANYDEAVFSQLLLTAVNGRVDLKNQGVEVMYLKEDQRLHIPAGLGLNPTTDGAGRAPRAEWLVNIYWRATTVTAAEIQTWHHDRTPLNAIRANVLAREMPDTTTMRTNWTDGFAEGMDSYIIDNYFARFSMALKLNYDIRDTGVLNDEGMYVEDTAWKDISAVTVERLRPKLMAYSLQCIAALNYLPCAELHAAAWARAYGVSCGLMPSPTSQSQVEYRWTAALSVQAHMTSLSDWEREQNDSPIHLCLNLLAMFGLFHLNKDHTYKSQDANMERICTSWLNTLRTLIPQTLLETLQANKEAACRTAAHPFGLAQTYWLAKVMKRDGKLAKALSLRTDVTPPNVQRIMIVDAARKAWGTIPAGAAVNSTYEGQIAVIAAEVQRIKDEAPAYSGLFFLYGCATQKYVPAAVVESADSMMPIVSGYAETVHTDEKGKREGLALALSLLNVRRDMAAIAHTWATMWAKYIDAMETGGIMDFAKKTMETFYGAVPSRQVPGIGVVA